MQCIFLVLLSLMKACVGLKGEVFKYKQKYSVTLLCLQDLAFDAVYSFEFFKILKGK